MVKPTDQGEESIVLVVVVVGGTIFHVPMYSFWGCVKAKSLSQKGCVKAKTLSQKGYVKAKSLSQKGCVKANTLSQKGWEKAKTMYIWFIDLSEMLYSTLQISERIPFLCLGESEAAICFLPPSLLFPQNPPRKIAPFF